MSLLGFAMKECSWYERKYEFEIDNWACPRGHTTATVAQAQLGHADPRVTLGICSHVIGESHREAV
jgi:hypothetical protein